jgi:hypothetical protein
VRGQRLAPAAFYPRERTGNHYTGGWHNNNNNNNNNNTKTKIQEFMLRDAKNMEPAMYGILHQ